ncbi:AAA family ATPase [Mycobacteroides abscessus]|uniref:AAA family ATPase n=1 Tax=Mycobacteroides abscessus TaxID=36809 RepID=UPI000C25E048|nr:AAA family ATPase [Mycobacteroides abscessus]
MSGEWDPRQDDEYAEYLRGERLAQAANADARRLEAAQAWTPPPYPASAYEQLAEEPPEVDWIFKDLWPAGNLQINAQKKAGKTTVAMNAAASLVTGEPFLGRFEVNVETDCRVGYLNMELRPSHFNHWLATMDLPDDSLKRLVPYHGRENGRLDLTNDAVVEWAIGWLQQERIELLVLDPLGSFYDQPQGGDPNAAYLRWWARLEHVVLQAKLRGVLIVHHTGYSEDGGNRARGASAMMDKPDVNVTYRYNTGEGSHTDAPTDNKRYLSAFGRDVDVPEFEIDYNTRVRRLAATGGGGRGDSEAEHQAERLHTEVLRAHAAGKKPNMGELFAALGWETSGRSASKYKKWYRYAIDQKRYVTTIPGKGREVLHEPGDCKPERRITLGIALEVPDSQEDQ